MKRKKVVETIESLCPRCLKKIPADLVEERNRVLIKKECLEHGRFEDIYWGGAEMRDTLFTSIRETRTLLRI